MNGNHLVLHSPVGFVVAFGAGIISFLSPCVLPLVPSYLSMMSGVSAAELADPSSVHQRRLLRSTLLFVAGFTVVFALLEATATGVEPDPPGPPAGARHRGRDGDHRRRGDVRRRDPAGVLDAGAALARAALAAR